MKSSDSSQPPADAPDAPTLALADIRALLDRLTAFRRQLGAEDRGHLYEAFGALEQSGLMTSSAYGCAAATIILMGVQTGRTPAALCAVAIRAVETAAMNAQYSPEPSATEWRQTIQRVSTMARPSLPAAWREALDETPAELAVQLMPLQNVGRHGFAISNAAAALDRAIAHYSIAARSIHALVPRQVAMEEQAPITSNGELARTFHAIISGNRALARTFVHVARFVSAEAQNAITPTRSEAEMPDPALWMRAAWRISAGHRLPAAIASTLAFRLAGITPPNWVNQLAAARPMTFEPEFDRAFGKTASNLFLKIIPRPGEPEPAIADQTPTQSHPPPSDNRAGQKTSAKPYQPRYEPAGSVVETSDALVRVARNPFLAKTNHGID